MALVSLITIVEADAILIAEIYPAWDALSDPVKQHHIDNASLYTQVTWACTGEDFVTPTLSADAVKAVALYAEADRAGNLYDDINAVPSAGGGGATTKLSTKAGSVEKTEEFSTDTVSGGSDNPLQSADDIFGAIGCTLITGGGDLTRV